MNIFAISSSCSDMDVAVQRAEAWEYAEGAVIFIFSFKWTDHPVALKNHQKLLEMWHASKVLSLSFSYRRYAQSGHSLAQVARIGRTEEQEGKAMEAKHMKRFGSAEGFWAAP